MANELAPSGTFSYAKGNISQKSLSVTGKTFTITGTNYVQAAQTITTSPSLIDVGNLSSLGWALIKNNDVTNPVDILSAISGTHMFQIQAGEFFLGRFATSITAPAAVSTGGSVQIEFLICEI